MDVLNYTTLDFDKPWTWVGLQISGKSLKELIGTPDDHFPVSMVQDCLPLNPDSPESGTSLIGVCGCGEWGCSFTSCRVTHSKKLVTLTEFRGYKVDMKKNYVFQIERANFDVVVGDLVALSRKDEALFATLYKKKV